jgi:large subunit ribosomal protein L32e
VISFLSQSQEPRSQKGPSRAEVQKYLQMRALKKSKTPEFQRQESWRYVRIHDPWRKPKGVDSHMRLSIKGWPALVKIGYRGPKEARGLHPSGYRDVLVHNEAELEALSRDSDAARLAATVGRRKKIELAIRARELGIRVLNGRGLLPTEVKAPEGEEEEKEKEKQVKSEERIVEETSASIEPSEEQQNEEEQKPQEEARSTESPSDAESEQAISPSVEVPSGVVATEQATEQRESETVPSEQSKPKRVSKAKKKPAKKTPTKKAPKAKSKKRQSRKKKSKKSE